MIAIFLFCSMLFLSLPCNAQRRLGHPGHVARRTSAPLDVNPAGPLQLLGIRPGIMLDSVQRIAVQAGVELREVPQDTLTHCFADRSIRIFVIDSIISRLTYMRMSFLFDGSNMHLRRFTITPRESSILNGIDDDIMEVLLLYFGEKWGKPEIEFTPPAFFRWRSGNIEVRGFIKRGYPIWVMEG